VNYPQGDGFAGIYESEDVEEAIAGAYIAAINQLLIGRKGREYTYATVG
jgi:hypothetical protein